MLNWRFRRLRGLGNDSWSARIQRCALRVHADGLGDRRVAAGRKPEKKSARNRASILSTQNHLISKAPILRHAVMVSGVNEEELNTNSNTSQRPSKELQDLVDLVPQVLVELEADGRWIHVNRAACDYTGLTLDEYKSVDVGNRVIHPDDIERLRSERSRGFTGSVPFEFEGRMLGKDSGYRWFLFRYRPSVEEGRVKKWYGSATDIEMRKQEEERVKEELVRLEERTRIAQELHDTLLQSFALVSLRIGVAVASLPSGSCVRQQMHDVLQLVEMGIEEGRSAILDLRSAEPALLDLPSSLSSIHQDFLVESGSDFQLVVVGKERLLQEQVGREIYRIGREALTNAFRHSRASLIEVKVEYADTGLVLCVQDNGCGIDPEVLRFGREGHCGLTGMRERAERIRGSLNIQSKPTGTDVLLRIPCAIAFPSIEVESSSAWNLAC